MHQWLCILLIAAITFSCGQAVSDGAAGMPEPALDSSVLPSYSAVKESISKKRLKLAAAFRSGSEEQKRKIREEITACWIDGISYKIYPQWAGTPWDFNGTTLVPQQGAIACGFFVTSVLQDMGLVVNRNKISTCAASELMHSLVPGQKIKKLNNPDYGAFCDRVKGLGKGVYLIGLDFHIGIIVNDDGQSWFIHSYYINRQGVIKEPIESSRALQASVTKWVICLTADDGFIERWLRISK